MLLFRIEDKLYSSYDLYVDMLNNTHCFKYSTLLNRCYVLDDYGNLLDTTQHIMKYTDLFLNSS